MSVSKIFLLATCLFATTVLAIDDGDDFNDNLVDTNKWGADVTFGNGTLTETNSRLEYTVSKGTKFDEVDRLWTLSQFPTTNDWEVILNVANAAGNLPKNAVASIGFYIRNWKDPFDNISAEMYTSTYQGGTYRGFYSSLFLDTQFVNYTDTFDLGITVGAIRVTFNSLTKVLTVWYDTDPANGYQWTQYGAYGIAGSGGNSGFANWNLTDADRFELVLYGYGYRAPVTTGQVASDDLATTEAVAYQIAPTVLTGTFTGVKQTCKTTCSIKGKLIMTNGTTSPVLPTHIRLFASADQNFDDGVDTLLSSPQTKALKPGKAGKLKVAGTNPTTLSGQYLLAVDDSGTVVTSFLIP